MLKSILQKTVSVVILLLAVWVVYIEFVSVKPHPGSSLGGDSGPLTLAQSKAMHQDLGGRAEDPPLVLFVTSWCGVCKALENQLQELSVPYVRADIEQDRRAMTYYQGVTRGRTGAVPVTVVGEKVFVGLDTRNIVQELLSLVESYEESVSYTQVEPSKNSQSEYKHSDAVRNFLVNAKNLDRELTDEEFQFVKDGLLTFLNIMHRTTEISYESMIYGDCLNAGKNTLKFLDDSKNEIKLYANFMKSNKKIKSKLGKDFQRQVFQKQLETNQLGDEVKRLRMIYGCSNEMTDSLIMLILLETGALDLYW